MLKFGTMQFHMMFAPSFLLVPLSVCLLGATLRDCVDSDVSERSMENTQKAQCYTANKDIGETAINLEFREFSRKRPKNDFVATKQCLVCGRSYPATYKSFAGATGFCNSCWKKYPGWNLERARAAEAAKSSPSSAVVTQSQLETCQSCNEMMVIPSEGYAKAGQIINTPYGQKKVCNDCVQKIKNNDHRCYICKRKTDLQSDPGVYLCQSCKAKRMTPEKINAMIPRIQREVESLLKQPIGCIAKIVPCAYADLQKSGDYIELGRYSAILQTDPETGSQHVVENTCTIRFIRDIPHDLFQDVFAHELAHHWLQHNVSVSRTLKDEEGFAEWVAFQISRIHNVADVIRGHMENTDPVYGEGFREMKRRIESGRYKTPASLFIH